MSRVQDKAMPRKELERLYREAVNASTTRTPTRAGGTELSDALEELSSLFKNRNGYVRIGVDYRTGEYWSRYKWTVGQYAGFYVFVSGGALDGCLYTLCDKVHDVEAGKGKPLLDRPARRTAY